MEEQLISFETAKLARDEGFDWKTFPCYIIENKELNYDAMWENWNHNQYDDVVSAPSQSFLQKWLREKHGIHITIGKVDIDIKRGYVLKIEGAGSFQPHWNKKVIDKQRGIYSDENLICGTYEKALEKGLQRALKLINHD